MLLSSRSLRLALIVVAGAAISASPVLAQGGGQGGRQPQGQRGGGPGGPGGGGGMFGGMGMGGFGQIYEPPVSSRDLDKYAKILDLDAEQSEALTALLEASQQEFNEAARAARQEMDKLRDEARESRDREVWRQMGEQMEKFRKSRQKMEDTFFSDFKAVLNERQLEKFPKIERQRRREQTIGRGLMSGERIDLIRTIEDMKLTPEQLAAVEPTLELYEADLDRELQTRNTVYDESMGKVREMFEAGNMNEMQKVIERGREASKRVREVNRRYARQLETLLPSDMQTKFSDEVRRESFPMIYRPTQASRAIEAARGFRDLDENQKSALATLEESFTRELNAINRQLEQATLEREESVTAQDMMSRGWGGFGGDDGPLGDLRQKRRDLDTTTTEKLRALLTPEQAERLPRREDRFGPGGGDDRDGGRDRGRQQPRRRPGGGEDDAPPPSSRT